MAVEDVFPFVTGGLQLGESILNYKAQKEANATNLKIARERNKLAVDLMRENNKFKSPDTQASLMQYAGINPSGVQQGRELTRLNLAELRLD